MNAMVNIRNGKRSVIRGRLFAILLVVVMCFSLFSQSAFAGSSGATANQAGMTATEAEKTLRALTDELNVQDRGPSLVSALAADNYSIIITADTETGKAEIAKTQFFITGASSSSAAVRPLDTPISITTGGQVRANNSIGGNANTGGGCLFVEINVDGQTIKKSVHPDDVPNSSTAMSDSGLFSKIAYYDNGVGYKLYLVFTQDGTFAGKSITIKFIFTPESASYTVVATESENGTTGVMPRGDNDFQLFATPDYGYRFDHWESRAAGSNADYSPVADSYNLKGVANSTTLYETYTYTATITGDTEFRAVFAESGIDIGDTAVVAKVNELQEPPYIPHRPGTDEFPIEGYPSYGATVPNWKGILKPEGSPIVGAPAAIETTWWPTGVIKSSSSINRNIEFGWTTPTITIRLYAGETTDGDTLFDRTLWLFGNTLLALPTHTVHEDGNQLRLYFTMPDAEKLTLSVQFENQEPIIRTYDTGLDSAVTDLRNEFDKLEYLPWRYLINSAVDKAAEQLMALPENRADILANARAAIEGYIAGTNKDYITVSFNGQIVRVPDKTSQYSAFCAVLEQAYPREKGYWYFDTAVTQFGYWVNGFGGRLYTQSELDSGLLETAIITPNKTFAVGEPLPRSGLITGAQRGSLQYGVNGFYANMGVSSWRCSDGDKFSWGPSVNDGIADWDEAGGEVWHLAPNFTGDANVIAALSACDALTSGSSPEQITAARSAYKAIPATFWNGAYAQFLFRTYEPYKTAYDKLIAAEVNSGIVNPLPTVTASDALSGTLTSFRSGIQAPEFGLEWNILALARGGVVDGNYYLGYLEKVESYIAGLDSNKISSSKSTENSRLILALSSLGKDATDIGGKDLLAPYSDLDWVGKQGINGVAFALLALDSGGYDVDNLLRGTIEYDDTLDAEIISDGLIKSLLDAQHDDKGWALDDSSKTSAESKAELSDVDITAMVIQALAPYYHKSDAVTTAIDDALVWLKTKQSLTTGGFAGWGGSPENSTESDAQVIVALTALGIDPTSWEVSGGWNPLAALLDNYVTNGFSKGGDNVNDPMSTEQAAYALVAYDRFINGKNTLYNMSDAVVPVSSPIVPVDKTGLGAAISSAQSVLSAAKLGTAVGEYPQAAATILQGAISAAQAVFGNSGATQADVNTAAVTLTTAINTFRKSVIGDSYVENTDKDEKVDKDEKADSNIKGIPDSDQSALDKAAAVKAKAALAKAVSAAKLAPKASGQKVTVAKKKITVTFKKVSGVTKYKVQYRVKGTNKWKNKTIAVKGSGKASLVIKKLKAGKKYQIRVQKYTKVGAKVVVSKWGKIRTTGKVKR